MHLLDTAPAALLRQESGALPTTLLIHTGQHAIDHAVFFRDNSIWMPLTLFTLASMNRSPLFLHRSSSVAACLVYKQMVAVSPTSLYQNGQLIFGRALSAIHR
jgi:hypothetical protein